MVRDLEGGIVFWNVGAEELYGWPAGEVMGRRIDILHSEVESYQAAQSAVLEKGEWSGEFCQITKDGREVIVESRWTLVCDDAGQPRSVLAINTDITGRKQLEAQFLRAQRMESIGTLAGGIAHDLNNVLAPILMSVGLLKHLHKDEQTQAILEMLETSSKRGAEMLKQVLSFARGVDGKRTLLHQLFAPGDGKDCEGNLPKIHFRRNRDCRGRGGLTGDATQLHQVLLNLCVNARDAMPEGGTLTLAAENVLLDDHFTSLNPEAKTGPHVAIQVADTGAGIPAEIRQRSSNRSSRPRKLERGPGWGFPPRWPS